MTQPTTTAEYRAMGSATPKPERRGVKPRTEIKRTSGIGVVKRVVLRTEESLYPAWEQLLSLHGCDFWHCTVAQRSQAGFPDYVVFGMGWSAYVELKARNPITGRMGKVSVAQLRYKASIEASGNEWITFLLPDEWRAIGAWLSAKTGRFVEAEG